MWYNVCVLSLLSTGAPATAMSICRYREDGKDGMQFYTDPNYFFELWRQEMLKENDRLMHEKGKKVGFGVGVALSGCLVFSGGLGEMWAVGDGFWGEG